VCKLPFLGVDCSIVGCKDNCNNNGVCNNGTCMCALGFTGKYC
jgi:hypothetical protein